tara:strand:- start:1780 stop:2028 length:249 start_codon:yes stop_codon:yes gene_type:complete
VEVCQERNLKIKSNILPGTKCCASERGHYNFYYPDTNREFELTMKLEVEKLTWVSFKDYEAYRVISPENYLPVNVIWINSSE